MLSIDHADLYLCFIFISIIRRIGKNKAQGHHTSKFSCRVSIEPIAPVATSERSAESTGALGTLTRPDPREGQVRWR